MTSGVQCVMTAGTVLMPVWSASSWVMQLLEVSANNVQGKQECLLIFFCDQVEFHTAMLILVLVLDPSTWMMLLVLQVLVQLLECFSRPISSHNCLHSADAGVGCEGNTF